MRLETSAEVRRREAGPLDRYRGHAIVKDERGRWVYEEDGTLVSADKDRACGHCGQPNTPEGHDACLGTLPGVTNACCGHGSPDEAYVQYETRDGRAAPVDKFIRKNSLADAVAVTRALISKFYEVDAQSSLLELGGEKLLFEALVSEAKLLTPRYLEFVRAWNSIVDSRATDRMIFSESLDQREAGL